MINKKIGIGGAAVLLALSRIFTEACPLPDESTEYGMHRFTVVALSFLAAAAVFLPLLLVLGRTGGRSPLGAVASRSRLLSGFFGVLFSAYLLFCAAGTGLRSHYYAAGTVFDPAPSVYFYILVGAALLFAVKCGLEAVSRTGMVVAAILGALLVLIIFALRSDIRVGRLYPALTDEPERLFPDTVREFSLGAEYLVFASLCGSINGKKAKAVPLYLGGSCLTILLMTFLYNTVFGRLLNKLVFPFYTLSSVSDITLLHRINGIDATVWVMAGILRLALFAFAFRAVVSDCFGGGKAADIAAYGFCIAALMLSELFTAYPELHEPIERLCATGIPLVSAALILPAAAFLCTLKGRSS